ncbi:DnaJ domain-containing protein [Catalinimonas alkaloidigena]|uniref:DnaJ domain-containing protein n=1 Tax=Catalinimonas alkaloidigena TaxID=1075417 RepID=A0A1G9U0I5_9BACT|nr:J domain-containing protein [Catalinimonas alkaloidigena]SDM53381.1 DnaJ domain-containing protein [Catalinimonas alkaloidigena]
MKDYYSTLGISRNASQQEIKQAYRKLALKIHPDQNFNDPFFEHMFREVKEAYDVLMDEYSREAYDEAINKRGAVREEKRAQESREPSPEELITVIISNLRQMGNGVRHLQTAKVKTEAIAEYLSRVLNDDLIDLYLYVPYHLNREFVLSVPPLLRFLNARERNHYVGQLVKVARGNDLIVEMHQCLKAQISLQKRADGWYWTRNNMRYIAAALLICLIVGYNIFSKEEEFPKVRTMPYKTETSQVSANSNKATEIGNAVENNSNMYVVDKPLASKWKNNQLNTGDSPYDNYFGKGIYDKNYYNQITIQNGQDADVVVCLTNYNSNKTIRNEYIRAGDSFKMTSIPNGTYYIKTFYGNDWNPDALVMGRITGFFDTSPGFSQSAQYDDLIRLQQTQEGYSIYEITLYPVVGGNMESQPITAGDFFK